MEKRISRWWVRKKTGKKEKWKCNMYGTKFYVKLCICVNFWDPWMKGWSPKLDGCFRVGGVSGVFCLTFLHFSIFFCFYFQWACNIYINRKNLSSCEANSSDTWYMLGITLDAGCTLVWGGLVMDLRMWELVLMLPRFQSYTALHSPNPLCFIWRR